MKKIAFLPLVLGLSITLLGQVKPDVSGVIATKKMKTVAQEFAPVGEINERVYAVKSMIQYAPGKLTIVEKPEFISYNLDGSDQKEHVVDYTSVGVKKLYFFQSMVANGKIIYFAGYKDKKIKGMSTVLLVIDPSTFQVEKSIPIGGFTGSPYEMQYLAMAQVMRYNSETGVVSYAWLDKNSGKFKFHVVGLDKSFTEIAKKEVSLSSALYNMDMGVGAKSNFALVTDVSGDAIVFSINGSGIQEHKIGPIVSGKMNVIKDGEKSVLYLDYPGNKTFGFEFNETDKELTKTIVVENGSGNWLMTASNFGEHTVLIYDKIGAGQVPDKLVNAYAGVQPNTIAYSGIHIVVLKDGEKVIEKSIPRKTMSAYPSFFDYIDERTVESTSGFFVYEKEGSAIVLFNEGGANGYFSPKTKLNYVVVDGASISDKMSLGNMLPNLTNSIKISNGSYLFDVFGKKPISHGIITVK